MNAHMYVCNWDRHRLRALKFVGSSPASLPRYMLVVCIYVEASQILVPRCNRATSTYNVIDITITISPPYHTLSITVTQSYLSL
jgi:hypothetical protein